MSYSLMAGGKRVRPVLLTWTAEAFGLAPKDVEAAACAVEMLPSVDPPGISDLLVKVWNGTPASLHRSLKFAAETPSVVYF